MPIQVFLPASVGADAEVTLAKWYKTEGEAVSEGEPLADIETDKAVLEIAAEASGTLARILVPQGAQGVGAQTPLALIARDGESLDDLEVPAAPEAAGQAAAPEPAEPSASIVPFPASGAVEAVVPEGGRIFASPLARSVAHKAGVDLSAISGSGPNGRVIRVDVERYLVNRPAAPTAAPANLSAPAAIPPAATQIPHSNVRRVIADRLGESKRTIPHFYLTIDCRMDTLLKLRKQINEADMGLKLSVNDFVVKAAALAMCEVPQVNASWADEFMLQHAEVNISVAVSTDGGLLTPIVRNADRKSLSSISTEVRELASRARDGRLQPQEYQGGGFTISNLGMYGVREFAAIINPPQACILAVGATERRPVVRWDELAVGSVMTCTLSADHRVVDGVVGAQFLAAFKRFIEQPLLMMV